MIGEELFRAFLELLTEIGPDGRTQRISVIIAGILRFALGKATDDNEEGSLGEALTVLDEDPYSEGEEYSAVAEFIDQLCQKTGMKNDRVASRGRKYSIADNAIVEYCKWYDMPWED